MHGRSRKGGGLRLSEAELHEIETRGARVGEAAESTGEPPARARRAHPEDELQRAVCQYWQAQYPQTWSKTFHTPNGLAAKNAKLAAIFAGLGVKPGVPDLLCTARRGPFSGFALELKSATGAMRPSQSDWQRALTAEGWFYSVANSFEVACEVIRQYHALPPFDQPMHGGSP